MLEQGNKKKNFLDFFKNLDSFSYQFEDFFKKNKKILLFGFSSILVVFGAYLFYQEGYLRPREEKALNLFAISRDHFLKNYEENTESLEKTLSNNAKEGYLGFIDILEKYPRTKAAKFSNFYAGLVYYKLKKFEKAIEHLKVFSSKDEILPSIKNGIIGDALVGLNKKEEALNFYLKAANEKKNDFSQAFYYQKASLLAFHMEKYQEAEKYLNILKKIDSISRSSIDLNKYLAIARYKQKNN